MQNISKEIKTVVAEKLKDDIKKSAIVTSAVVGITVGFSSGSYEMARLAAVRVYETLEPGVDTLSELTERKLGLPAVK